MEPELTETGEMMARILPGSREGNTFAAAEGDYIIMGTVGIEVCVTIYRDLPACPTMPMMARMNALNSGMGGGAHAIVSGREKSLYRFRASCPEPREEAALRRFVRTAKAEAARGYRYIVKGE